VINKQTVGRDQRESEKNQSKQLKITKKQEKVFDGREDYQDERGGRWECFLERKKNGDGGRFLAGL
jgi:hypothetical protein